jgi:hypothetical protein
MTITDWLTFIGLLLGVVIPSVGGTVAYLLRQIDQIERRLLSHITEVYARQVDLVRLQEQLVSANAKLDLLLERQTKP